ncbi:MAG: hypothetical protein AB8B61_03915 [Cyclobacteriaceae bacterium]
MSLNKLNHLIAAVLVVIGVISLVYRLVLGEASYFGSIPILLGGIIYVLSKKVKGDKVNYLLLAITVLLVISCIATLYALSLRGIVFNLKTWSYMLVLFLSFLSLSKQVKQLILKNLKS